MVTTDRHGLRRPIHLQFLLLLSSFPSTASMTDRHRHNGPSWSRSKKLQLLESGYWDHFSELHDEPTGRTIIATTDRHKLHNPTLGWTSPSSFSSCTAATYRPSQARRTVISSVGGLFCISSLKISAFIYEQISCK